MKNGNGLVILQSTTLVFHRAVIMSFKGLSSIKSQCSSTPAYEVHTFHKYRHGSGILLVVLVTRVTKRSFDQKILMSFGSHSESHLFLI
jgi:hypothetical protein